MKIVQISTNTLPVPPEDYGGTQRDIHYLTEELVRRGHEVILFAKKGSKTNATRTYEYPTDDPDQQLDFIIKRIPSNVDIIHDHYGIVAKTNPPIPTLHNSHSKKAKGSQIPVFVSKKIRDKNKKGYFVHNGIRLRDYTFRTKKKGYLLFLGRIMKEKGVHLAIEVAQKTGKELIIAGTINKPAYQEYFDNEVKPHLNEKIRFIGPVGGTKKINLISRASCVLFTSTWNEPFGLVLIEALACGTPVLGFKAGAVPEVLKGLPQLLCNSTDDMVRKVKYRNKFPTARVCRSYVKKHFSDKVMADNFLKLYKKVITNKEYKIVRQSVWNTRKNLILKRS
ncbi:glycosyltransferase family 4 protein [Paenibacillus sp. MABNR03]|uniref:glycosyltransferase family 4 protein n=1 Tax=Paenibacillus sp. MABNR03 TaxID=3142626 RepID=UPI003D273018